MKPEPIRPKGFRYIESHFNLSCDDCKSQEGRHYCLLYGLEIKNMDIHVCDDIEVKEGE